ncbi:hypothetical protein Pmar_PMAR010147 [Perkinsus marinus ATCC 50983]|uniref:Uncharacterized protein n=1 Tax=Perkinsus marinus (strain ATCC 50983 / TXsc) TaxID=423536 RepID=C5K4Z0_PERM5|nr:hypothetical protein Pmar_PMAR010147 [Perkinsus marinus ATCC 50983]EER20412.1 hypothetical protein Pmar_PMAR010147 [Perkinsus marinus ATCC 50983]|eukprot:XP_002788616.1 hypothetical protein Pmar_PMAR010147 [Perkinsus marinus ATCC 50983]
MSSGLSRGVHHSPAGKPEAFLPAEDCRVYRALRRGGTLSLGDTVFGLPPIVLCHGALAKEINKAVGMLSSLKTEWRVRQSCLGRLARIVLGWDEREPVAEDLARFDRDLAGPLAVQVRDDRSAIVKQASMLCIALGASTYGEVLSGYEDALWQSMDTAQQKTAEDLLASGASALFDEEHEHCRHSITEARVSRRSPQDSLEADPGDSLVLASLADFLQRRKCCAEDVIAVFDRLLVVLAAAELRNPVEEQRLIKSLVEILAGHDDAQHPALLECFPPALVSEQSGHYRPDVTQKGSPIDILLECDGTNEEDQEQV